MKRPYSAFSFRKVILPIIHDCDYASALAVARAIARQGQVVLVGVVPVVAGESLSLAALPARQVRKTLRQLEGGKNVRAWERVCVSHQPWEDLVKIVQEEHPDLLLLEWPCQFDALQITPDTALAHPPCDVALVKGPIAALPQRILLPIRGGPYAELALRLSLSVAQSTQAQVSALHILPRDMATPDIAFRGLRQVLINLPEIKQEFVHTDDPLRAIVERAPHFEMIIVGATASPAQTAAPLGRIATHLLQESQSGVIVVKTRHPMPESLVSESVGRSAISILVDKWFAENTYHADEFADLDYLLGLKRRQNLTISLALPALNEEATVGNVIQTLKSALMDQVPLLDEIVLMDSDSTDRTRQIAADLGVPVFVHQQVLPQYGVRHGKGEALWKSLYVTHGDLVLWVDTDIVNIHPRFVYGLIGPLLLRHNIQFVKGFYRRPLKVGDKVQAGGGGRVTELTARPLINLFYPELSGVVQPLSGEYGGRRSALEQLPFFSGYGVEIGLLIDVFEKFGLSAIAQVDLMERIHHNQPLESLSKMSFAIIQAVIHKLEQRYGRGILEDVNKTMKLIRYEPGRFFLEVEEIAEQERPPMITLPEYGLAHAGDLAQV